MVTAYVLEDRPATGVACLRLNRPEKLNALSKALLCELARHLHQLEHDAAIGCVVLTGEGRAFSAGADIDDMLARGVHAYADPDRLTYWRTIAHFPKPLIAAVNGFALGGGLELALLCDIIIANQTAAFAMPEITLGSFPGDGGTQRLPRLVGKSFAMQMILTGQRIDANTAERKGLVSEVTPPHLLEARMVEIATTIARHSRAITPYAKRAVNAADEYPLAQGLAFEHRLTVEAFDTYDRVEGLRAFAQKRAPQFQGR